MEGLRMKNKRLCQENDNLTKRVKFLTVSLATSHAQTVDPLTLPLQEQLNKEGLDHVSATVEGNLHS